MTRVFSHTRGCSPAATLVAGRCAVDRRADRRRARHCLGRSSAAGSTGVHGVFPPVPAQGMPATLCWMGVEHQDRPRVLLAGVYTRTQARTRVIPAAAVNV
jgi:hypothetical protein